MHGVDDDESRRVGGRWCSLSSSECQVNSACEAMKVNEPRNVM